jgi:signal transduction histidine kinase/GAF domain-containing protein
VAGLTWPCFRYYQPAFSRHFTLDHTPRSSTDTALSAFAQLATLRLGTRRALISLIDRTEQHVLAEATQTLSLQSDLVHDDRDELWFGCTTFPRALGLCEEALSAPSSRVSASPSSSLSFVPMVVNDITKNPRFKGKPFLALRPSVRFFASVPLRTKTGFEIGTLSVMSDMPRNGLSDVEAIFLEDLALTVMDHLEMTRVKEAHRRGEKMVKGLGLFVDGRSHLGEWWLDDQSASEKVQNRSGEASLLQESNLGHAVKSGKVRNLESRNMSSLPGNVLTKAHTLSTNSSTLTPSLNPTLPHLKSFAHQPQDEPVMSTPVTRARIAPGLQESMLSANLKDMFSRASNIIKQCIEVDGTLFLDGSIGTFGGHTGESHRRLEQELRIQNAEISDPSSNNTSPELFTMRRVEARRQSQKKCGILGYSSKGGSSLEQDQAPESFTMVPESFLQDLLNKYPRGQVFDIDEEGFLIPPVPSISDTSMDGTATQAKARQRLVRLASIDNSKAAEAIALVKIFPGARSVAFSPMWDSHRERFFSGCFAWTTQPTRVLRPSEDLNYLAAFGQSIMAEVARLDAVAADQAKSDFISSISHELRTPLHGVLASVEFLQDTTIDLFQISMIDTIERCGRTLLDTIQHVLDFAKINSFIKPGVDKSNPKVKANIGSSSTMALSIDIDLSVVTEDVIDSMHAGHEFGGKSELVVANQVSSPIEIPSNKERLEIIMDIDWRSNWAFNTQSGALRRILMNVRYHTAPAPFRIVCTRLPSLDLSFC